MNGYRFTLSCPSCGSPLEHRQSVEVDEWHTVTEVWCEPCMTVWNIDVHLSELFAFRAADECRRERAGSSIALEQQSVMS